MSGYKRGRGGDNADAISDRSGFRYPMREMIIEEGTGYLIHYSEDDGEYNLVDHPVNHPQRYVEYGDPFPVEQARPERDLTDANPLGLETETGQLMHVGGDGQGNYLLTE